MNYPFVSLLISTRNRANFLRECLSSITKLDYPGYEIIVVDESTTDFNIAHTKRITLEVRAKYIREKKQGVSVGHNTGIKAAKSDIIAITDDDCVVDRNWLTFLVQNFSDQCVMCVAGRTKSFETDEISSLFERQVSFDRGSEKREFDKSSVSIRSFGLSVIRKAFSKRFLESTPAPWGVGYGNNIAYRKSVFEKIGFFDEKLGRGTKATGGDDTDLIYRVLKTGFKAIYEPRAFVWHKHRETFEKLKWDVCYSNGLANHALLSKHIRTDPYAMFCYFSGITHLGLVLLGSSLKADHRTKLFTTLELCGWLNIPLRYGK
jgi:GT2 family glycosyltransferase